MNQAALSQQVNEELDHFATEIDKGLSKKQKQISSKYFYDKKGDNLFTQIMGLDEYYLTRSEFEIFHTKKNDIYSRLPFASDEFDLVELGSGDGAKTKILLEHIYQHNQKFHYLPIDISENALILLQKSLSQMFPVNIQTYNNQYMEGLRDVYKTSLNNPKLILFLGSNIGNLTPDQACEFLRELSHIKGEYDILLIGIDLKKDPQMIRDAYNDSKGITAQFNLNVLDRINNELNANFNSRAFSHYPIYDPGTGAAKSYLISKLKQTVFIEYLNKEFHFEKDEAIFTEISQKYSKSDFIEISKKAGLTPIDTFMDSNNYFASFLLQ